MPTVWVKVTAFVGMGRIYIYMYVRMVIPMYMHVYLSIPMQCVAACYSCVAVRYSMTQYVTDRLCCCSAHLYRYKYIHTYIYIYAYMFQG